MWKVIKCECWWNLKPFENKSWNLNERDPIFLFLGQSRKSFVDLMKFWVIFQLIFVFKSQLKFSKKNIKRNEIFSFSHLLLKQKYLRILLNVLQAFKLIFKIFFLWKAIFMGSTVGCPCSHIVNWEET